MKFLTQIALLVIMLSTSIAFFTRGNMKGCFGGILRRPLSMAAKDTATTAIGANKVMVFSKSKCPFCRRAKEALGELKIEYGVIELGEFITQIIRKFPKKVSQNSVRLTFLLHKILRWPTWNGGTRTTESFA
jgi:thioredoxin-related protein